MLTLVSAEEGRLRASQEAGASTPSSLTWWSAGLRSSLAVGLKASVPLHVALPTGWPSVLKTWHLASPRASDLGGERERERKPQGLLWPHPGRDAPALLPDHWSHGPPGQIEGGDYMRGSVPGGQDPGEHPGGSLPLAGARRNMHRRLTFGRATAQGTVRPWAFPAGTSPSSVHSREW